jgi:hypothetical protein
VEIRAKPAAVDPGGEVAAGRGHHPDIDGDGGATAEPANLAALEHAEDAGLELDR